MTNKKNIPTEISTQELLELIKTLPEEPVEPKPQLAVAKEEYVPKDVVLSFVMAFEIKIGEDKVYTRNLYKLFKLWSESDVSLKTFTTRLSILIPSTYEYGKTYFYINKNWLNIAKIIDEKKVKKTRHQYIPLNSIKKINKWLKSSNLKTGDIYIEADILFFVFDTWCYRRKESTPRLVSFTRYMKRIFNNKKFNEDHQTWFGVDEQIYNCITDEAVRNWRYYREKNSKTPGMPKDDKLFNVAFSEVRYEIQKTIKKEREEQELKKKQRKISRLKT
jgi:hypothetical protein